MQKGNLFIEGHFFHYQGRSLIGGKAAIHPGARRQVVFRTHLSGNRQQRKSEDRYAKRQ
jgi:hypothetical protein